MDAESAYAVYDLRALLEPEAVRRAVERGADFGEARQVLADVETGAAAADRAKASLTNRLFHRALYAGCGNPLLVEIAGRAARPGGADHRHRLGHLPDVAG